MLFANIIGSNADELMRSFTYNRKSNGTNPWGFPQITLFVYLFQGHELLKYTVFCLLSSYRNSQGYKMMRSKIVAKQGRTKMGI